MNQQKLKLEKQIQNNALYEITIDNIYQHCRLLCVNIYDGVNNADLFREHWQTTKHINYQQTTTKCQEKLGVDCNLKKIHQTCNNPYNSAWLHRILFYIHNTEQINFTIRNVFSSFTNSNPYFRYCFSFKAAVFKTLSYPFKFLLCLII